jgi:diguanylate cyclase (GGDEF)-like protein
MTSARVSIGPARGGLRRQWRTAFAVMISALLLALGGVTATYLQVSSHYQVAARNLDAAISQTSQLDAAVNDHEIQSHLLWQGSPIDRAAYLRGQDQITTMFQVSLRELQGTGEHALVARAWQTWRSVLTSRGLWGAQAGPKPGGVTAAMQAAYGKAQDQVYFAFGQLSVAAIRDGSHDLTVADRFQTIGIGLLVAAFALVLAIVFYFGRRLTTDVVHPIERLQAAANRLREGSLEYRIDGADSTHANEIRKLADAFNDMADALSASHSELAQRAAVDSLTGLANRASFNERLRSHINPDDRRSQTVSVLFVDIDDFKFVNDSVGHAGGDALLAAVAERLASCARSDDFVARLGGDEFAIMVVGTSADTTAADSMAQRVLNAFRTPFVLGDRQFSIAVSIGVSAVRRDASDAESLIAEADFAMYSAKRAGNGRREIFDAATTAIVAPKALAADARAAVT